MAIVSVIIPTWNTADITKKCVDSILDNSPPDYFEIIIIDNHSTDSTRRIFSPMKNITYLRNRTNLGFSRANNLAVKKATTDYLFFLNSDMEFISSDFHKMLSFYQSHQDCGIVGPKFLNPDLSPQGSVFPPQTALNAFAEFWLNQPTFSKYCPSDSEPLTVNAVSGGALLISRKIFELLGGWNKKYFFYYEDLDLCRRLTRKKLKIYYYPDFKVVHHHGQSGQQLASSANQWRRLIPSSILYHGYLNHYFINLIIWSGQKWQKLKSFF